MLDLVQLRSLIHNESKSLCEYTVDRSDSIGWVVGKIHFICVELGNRSHKGKLERSNAKSLLFIFWKILLVESANVVPWIRNSKHVKVQNLRHCILKIHPIILSLSEDMGHSRLICSSTWESAITYNETSRRCLFNLKGHFSTKSSMKILMISVN